MLALAVIALSAGKLASMRAGLVIETVQLVDTPVTLYRQESRAAGPLVIVAHGFAGSRQMMTAISLTLARAGMTVAAFDFIGHGRHDGVLSPDIGRIEGTTRQLVVQTRAVTAAARARLDLDAAVDGQVALVGHSMATDILVRAAIDRPDIAALVLISMYSDAVTASFPGRLLIVSGEWESRLREVALDKVRQIDPVAGEGETARAGPIIRRAVVAPHVEHVGVLYSPAALAEIRAWLLSAFDLPAAAADRPVAATGYWILALLGAIVALYWPVSRLLLPAAPIQVSRIPARLFFAVVLAPVPVALGVTHVASLPIAGLAAFGQLAAFFLLWGLVQLVLLRRHVPQVARRDLAAAGLLLGWGLGLYAVAMDNVFASFVPTGARILVALVLALGTVPFLIADRVLVIAAPLWRRLLARIVVLATLAGGIMLGADQLGVAFTVLPVLLLFYLVYGTLGNWTARRGMPVGTGAALGLSLAWAIAASTPLFSVAPL